MVPQFHKIDLRRSLIRFSSTLVGLIAVIGIMSLFSIWSMNRAYISGNLEIEKIGGLEEEGLLAQIDFKVQVQEWKNILLRGYDPSARAKYMSAFENRESGVEKHLGNLSSKAAELGLMDYQKRALDLIDQHQKLASTYRNAMKVDPEFSFEGSRRIDGIVRGVDRDLENKISTLSQDISKFNKIRRNALFEQISQKYNTLRSVLLVVIASSMLIIAVALYSALRVTHD